MAEQKTNDPFVQLPGFEVAELQSYQKGILGILSKVEITHGDEELKQDIKSVYRLLDHLTINNNCHEYTR